MSKANPTGAGGTAEGLSLSPLTAQILSTEIGRVFCRQKSSPIRLNLEISNLSDRESPTPVTVFLPLIAYMRTTDRLLRVVRTTYARSAYVQCTLVCCSESAAYLRSTVVSTPVAWIRHRPLLGIWKPEEGCFSLDRSRTVGSISICSLKRAVQNLNCYNTSSITYSVKYVVELIVKLSLMAFFKERLEYKSTIEPI